jgi:hypothetical protein
MAGAPPARSSRSAVAASRTQTPKTETLAPTRLPPTGATVASRTPPCVPNSYKRGRKGERGPKWATLDIDVVSRFVAPGRSP